MREEEEFWWPVVGYEDYYRVSTKGRVCSRLRGYNTILKQNEYGKGYLKVDLKGEPKKVHHLVVEAFHGPIPVGMEVNHIDGDKKNNHWLNLQIVSRSENMKHAHANLPRKKKTYVVYDPEDTKYIVTDLGGFAKEYSLERTSLIKVAKGVLMQTKGWRCYHYENN